MSDGLTVIQTLGALKMRFVLQILDRSESLDSSVPCTLVCTALTCCLKALTAGLEKRTFLVSSWLAFIKSFGVSVAIKFRC